MIVGTRRRTCATCTVFINYSLNHNSLNHKHLSLHHTTTRSRLNLSSLHDFRLSGSLRLALQLTGTYEHNWHKCVGPVTDNTT